MKSALSNILISLVTTLCITSCGGDKDPDKSINLKDIAEAKEAIGQSKGSLMPWTSDKKLAIEKLMERGSSYSMLSESLKKDKEIVEIALENGMPFYMLDESFVKNKEITLLALKYDPEDFSNIHESFKPDPDVILASLKSRYDRSLKNLEQAPNELKNNSDFMVKVLQTRAEKQAIQRDHLVSGGESPVLFPYVVNALKKDKDFLYQAVSISGSLICDLDDSFKSERDLALSAVSQHGRALLCLNKELQEDREIVLAAVKQDGSALLILRDLRSDFINDKEIALIAINQAGAESFQAVGEKLQKDKDVLKLFEEKMAESSNRK